MQARQVWASLRATSDKTWTGQPSDFLLRPVEVVVEVDPVEYLSAFFGPPPPREGEEGPPDEVK